MICLLAKVTSRSLQEKFWNCSNCNKKSHQHTQSRMSEARFCKVNFIEKGWLKSFNDGFVYNIIVFKRFWRRVSKEYTQFFYKLFTRASRLGGAMGVRNFRNILPINEPKYNGGEIQVLWRETFKIYVNLQSRTWSIHFLYRHCGSHEYALSREKQPQRNLHNSQGFSQSARRCNYACKRYLWSCIL